MEGDYSPIERLAIQRASGNVVRFYVVIQDCTVPKRAVAQVHRCLHNEDIYRGLAEHRLYLGCTAGRRALEIVPKYHRLKLDGLALSPTATGSEDAILLVPIRCCKGEASRTRIRESCLSGVVAAGKRQVE